VKILIDALSAREGGGITYFRSLVPPLARISAHNEYTILLSPLYQQELIRSLPDGVHVAPVDLDAGDSLGRVWFQQVAIRQLIRSEGFDLLFSISETGTIHPPCAHVVLARNLKIYAPLSSFPSAVRRRELLTFRLTREPIAYLSCRSASRVVFVSQYFRDHVVRHLQLNPARTSVVYHGVSPQFCVRVSQTAADNGSDSSRQGSYILCVSSITSHKNIDNLIRAFAILKTRNSKAIELVLAGTTAEKTYYQELIGLTRSLGVSAHVHFLGRVEHGELPALYAGARAFVFPSRLESFGQPLVEAMASGVPVASAWLPACREICGDAALYFDPNDIADMADRLTTLLESGSVRERLVTTGRTRASTFSWHRCAAQMTEIFNELHGDASASRPH